MISLGAALQSELLVSAVPSLSGKIKWDMWRVRVNGAALNKDYCWGQFDNKRDVCEVTDNMTSQISDVGREKWCYNRMSRFSLVKQTLSHDPVSI